MNVIEYQKRVEGTVVNRFNVSPADTVEIDLLLAAKSTTKVHGNSKAVFICSRVDESIYRERMEKHGAKPITEMDFPSSKAASLHFGYHTDEVGYALRQAKQRGDDIAVVAGVPLQRVADIRD